MTSSELTLDEEFGPGGRFEGLGELERGFIMLDRKLWRHFTNGEHDECGPLADMMLLEPELPLLLRARTLIVISATPNGASLMRAQEAYRLLDEDVRADSIEQNVPFPQEQFEMAGRAVQAAKRLKREDWVKAYANDALGVTSEEIGNEVFPSGTTMADTGASVAHGDDTHQSTPTEQMNITQPDKSLSSPMPTSQAVEDVAEDVAAKLVLNPTTRLITPAPSREPSKIGPAMAEESSPGTPLSLRPLQPPTPLSRSFEARRTLKDWDQTDEAIEEDSDEGL